MYTYLILAELLVDKAMELRYIGGVYSGNIKPSPFLCLTLKMLQIQPEKDSLTFFMGYFWLGSSTPLNTPKMTLLASM